MAARYETKEAATRRQVDSVKARSPRASFPIVRGRLQPLESFFRANARKVGWGSIRRDPTH